MSESTTAPETESKIYRLSEVSEHKDRTSAWIVIDNKVYDVTEFLEEHPGGEEVILDKGGQDSTEDFEDVGHSTDARALMAKYQIGELHEDDKIKREKKTALIKADEKSSCILC